ncbi:hypothetical protein FRC14_005940 [Serendipita sp. 396]|nr:hypothetical protein FRC14_005940 [Serendipita sp. 396]KAG8779660.1 hypothetical protein FRC15_010029 [Serendipita sp. 397]KAG8797842.1 hypothetical protein FRC16_008462 [Serendipita sp. 398]KAG8836588.1 hypothetical protein FRC18_011097 [Serendipita sp. 400]
MIIRKSQQAAPIDRPFPDENTVAEIYCNEAYTVDNEAVEDWTSSLQMLLTFAAIFSAVLITLIVDSKTLLKQDNTDVLVDAVVFLMNNLANGTHQPYSPPKFRPSTRSILVNCFFFASLCLSIATALAAVLAMQWVTDYGAVTRRAGSTPEERVKRRHFRYQGGLDWKVDTIIGALPIALHLSVLLFFVGLIVWMWDVHHSVFGVVFVCGALAALFYIATATLAVFCPSCPYRTPLASWIYILLHMLTTIMSRFTWLRRHESGLDEEMEEGAVTGSTQTSRLQRSSTSFHSRFAQHSLSSRDDVYIQSPDKTLMRNSLIWLSNHISISSEVYKRLLVLINGFASVLDEDRDTSPDVNVPWLKIYNALGSTYMSFVRNLDLSEEEFVAFASQIHCLTQPGMKGIVMSKVGSGEIRSDSAEFPARLLHAWTKSVFSHTSDELRRQRFSDEIVVRDCINNSPFELLKTWYELLEDEVQTCQRILPGLLDYLVSQDKAEIIDVILYIISTGILPWASTVPFDRDGWPLTGNIPSRPFVRRLRVVDWVDNLSNHPHQEKILETFRTFRLRYFPKILPTCHELTDEESAELNRMGLEKLDRWKRPEAVLHSALVAFDRTLARAGNLHTMQDMLHAMVSIICGGSVESEFSFDSTYFSTGEGRKLQSLRRLSNPTLRLVACAMLGIKWDDKWFLDPIKGMDQYATMCLGLVCFGNQPFINGDGTGFWFLKFRTWMYDYDDSRPAEYSHRLVNDLDTLQHAEREIQSTQLGIMHAVDFILVLYHLNYSYTYYQSLTLVPDILVGNTTSLDPDIASKECIEYLTSICHDISNDPARLIRLLIELVRADINHHPYNRRPSNLLNLLMHAKTHLCSKELRSFGPSCHRLIKYIRGSYKQFEATWDNISNQEHYFHDSRSHYERVDRDELKTVCDEVIAFLEPMGPWDGQEIDVSWPRHFLRPTKTTDDLFEEESDGPPWCYDSDADDQEPEDFGRLKDEGDVPPPVIEVNKEDDKEEME